MADHAKAARTEQERLYGTQEAAKLLGLHRSTINVAVRKRLLIPDQQTPGGHLRFRQATLQAFRERLAACPATGAGATLAPVHLLADLSGLLARNVAADVFAARIVASLPRALPNIEVCVVAHVAADPVDRLAPRLMAHTQVPDEVRARFEQLKTTFKFAVTTVLRTLSPEYCEDISAAVLHTGTFELLRIWPLGCYAALPVIAGERPVGALICAGSTPRHFTDYDRALLGAVANLLSIALARYGNDDSMCPQVQER